MLILRRFFPKYRKAVLFLKVVRAYIATLKLILSEMSSATESGELHKVSTNFDRQHRARVIELLRQKRNTPLLKSSPRFM